jgi:hypothetical protein
VVSNNWVAFFELVERLKTTSPELVELALRYGRGGGQQVLGEVERELGARPNGQGPREPLFDNAQKLDVGRCAVFLEDLRKQENELRDKQAKAAQELLQVETARRAFEKALKEMLEAERRSFATDEWAGLRATGEEVAAGLQELKEKGGLELHEFIGELEQVAADRERTGT